VTQQAPRSWTWRYRLRQVITTLQEEGLKSLWIKILSKTVYRRQILFERPLHEPIALVRPRLPVVVSLLQETEVEEYLGFRPEADPSQVCRRLKAGQLCFVARYEHRIVCTAWATTTQAWTAHLGREIPLAAGEVYIYDVLTAPDVRGQQITTLPYLQMLEFLRDAGYRRVVTIIIPENAAALRLGEKLGYRRFGVIGHIQLGTWRWHFCRIRRDGGLTSWR
jgi:GNAT superfamily N-acetyltransferase